MIDWILSFGAPWFSQPPALLKKERMENNCHHFYSHLKEFLMSNQSKSKYHEFELNLQEDFAFDFTRCPEFQQLHKYPTIQTIEFQLADSVNQYARYYHFERSCRNATHVKIEIQ